MSLTIGTVKLTFYGGANEIGGNKVLLEDFENDVKVFMDFGINSHKLNKFKDDYGNPSTLDDLTKTKLMPPEDILPIENLYSTH